jgi:hypothetical protein
MLNVTVCELNSQMVKQRKALYGEILTKYTNLRQLKLDTK